MLKLVLLLLLFSLTPFCKGNDFSHISFEFGQVIFNEHEEAIDFQFTDEIPILDAGKTVMYGVIVTSDDDQTFTLDSLHTMPTIGENTAKMIGKTINVRKKAAIFLRTQQNDIPGNYTMEIFIDGVLAKTFGYQLIAKQNTKSR